MTNASKVNKDIVETCNYLQSQDKNGNYLDIVTEITAGELTEQKAVVELKSVLSGLISEFNEDEDKRHYQKISAL